MQYTLFGAIDIGSSEMELKIFELSRGKGMREIDCIRNRLELGKDTYATGKISTEKLEELCLVLNDFISIMKSYKVEAYRAYTTSAIREAKNRVILLDYLEKKTGLKIEVLDNAEQRFLDYKSIAAQANEFNRIIEKGTAILDVGGGSVQVSLFDKDSLVSTQNIRIGNLRIRERVAAMEHMYGHFEELVQELTRSELQNFKKMYVKDREVSNVILVGDYLGGLSKKQSVSLEEFQTIYDGVVHVEPSVAAERFELPEESISLISPPWELRASGCRASTSTTETPTIMPKENASSGLVTISTKISSPLPEISPSVTSAARAISGSWKIWACRFLTA